MKNIVEHLQFVIQQQSNPSIFMDEKGIVRIINSIAEKTLKYSKSEVIGQYFHLITSDINFLFDENTELNITAEICPLYEVIFSQKSLYKDDDVFWRRDGSVFNVEYYADPVFDSDGSFAGVLVNFSDVSKRLNKQNVLLDNEERQRLIVDNSVTAIISIDSDGQIVDWNKQAEIIFGWSKVEALERSLEEMIVPERYHQKHREGLNNFFKTGEIKSHGQFVEIEARRKNGEEFSLEISFVPFVTRFGQHIVCATCQDITERKDFLTELVRANERSLAANRSKSEFLSNMSHEIRTPLTSIIGFAEALQKNTLNEVNARNDAIHMIVNNGTHLLSLINDILDYSKVEEGKLKLEYIEFDFYALVSDIVTMMEPEIKDKGLDFIAEIITPCPQFIVFDPTRLKQVLVNLLGNAIKFTEKGYIRLTISYDGLKKEIIFSLLDTGVGISDENQKKLFQSFNQVDNSVSRKYGGTGLGLSISKRLCRLFGGDLRVQSTKGSGSLFYFNLVLYDFDAANLLEQAISRVWINDPEQKVIGKANEEVIQRAVFPGNTVLLAEDTPSNQKLISMYLKAMQVDFEIVENGSLAVEAAIVTDYDLILMDMQMPVMGGVEATEMLRATGYDGPIVALTANVMAQDRDKFETAGCDDFLPKPLDIDKTYEVMEKFLKPSDSNHVVLDPMAGLHGSEEYKVLVDEFKSNTPKNYLKMKKFVDNDDFSEVQSLAHQLKGAGTSFGYPELSELGAEIETFAKLAEKDSLNTLLEELDNKIKELF